MLKRTPSIYGLISWLEKQPAETEYPYYNPRDCVICRYLRATRRWKAPWTKMLYGDVFDSGDQYRRVCGTYPWTFGAALARAKQEVS